MLLEILSPENAAQQGITIQGEAVINNEHTLYLIAESPDRQRLEHFLAPFAQAGTVEVLGASACTDVVERGGCALTLV